LARFDAEHDNLRAALDWSLAAAGHEQQGLRLAAACWKYWRVRGYLSEGRERLAVALGRPKAQSRTEARAWALLRASNLAYIQSDYPAVGPPAEEALAIFRELGLSVGVGAALALDALGELATEIGDYDTAPRLFEEALTIFRGLNDDAGTADMLLQLGYAAMRVGDYERAAALLDESLPIFRKVGDKHFLGFALAGLGELSIRQSHLDRAEMLLEESLSVRREIGERWGIAASLGSLGWLALRQRDFDRMRDYLRQSLEIRQVLGDRGGVAWCLEKLAEAAALQAQPFSAARRHQALRRAVNLFGAASALREPIHSVIDPADQPAYERALEALRGALGREVFDDVWRKGASLSLQQAIDAALSPLMPPDEAALAGSGAVRGHYGGLSPRERETAMWIAQGKSNREIAAVMIVGEKTVETYVTRILNKLGFDSRVQIATWAVEKGLNEKREL
jgi:DNA-binding CsgD family transcriptional regulator/tetratricopeptide (TPR) repeat protein